jgi:predicted DNA-binding transcriptional regulator AlpA
MDQKKILTEREAAEYVGFSAITLRNIRKGRSKLPKISYSEIGRCIRYRIEDLDTWLKSQRVVSKKS